MLRYFFVALMTGLILTSGLAQTKKKTPTTKQSEKRLYYQKAMAFKKQGRYDSAYAALNRALPPHIQGPKDLFTSLAYSQLALLDYRNHNYTAAEANAVKSLELLPASQPKQQAYLYSLLSLISKAEKKDRQFFYYNRLFYQLAKQQKDTLRAFIKYHNNTANFYLEKKDFTKALQDYNQILQIKGLKKQFPTSYVRALVNKAQTLIATGQKKEILNLLKEAENLALKNHMEQALINIYYVYALYFKQINNITLSRIYALQALGRSKKQNSLLKLPEIYKLLGEVDQKHASRYFKAYVRLKDSVLNKERALRDQSALIRYQTAQKEQIIKEQKLKIANQRNVLLFLGLIIVLIITGAAIFYRQKKKIKQQYTDLKEQDKKIRKQHEQLIQQHETIKALHGEIHHRISNNLAILSNSINQIKRAFKEENLINRLSELQHKITIINEIHQQLYLEQNFKSIYFKMYVDRLIGYFKEFHSADHIQIDNRIAEHIQLNFKKTLPLGIIIFEFLINSYKYAFKDQSGHIWIDMKLIENGQYLLILKDNGKGVDLPASDKPESFGLKLIKNLTKQLGGTLNLQNNEGFEMQILF